MVESGIGVIASSSEDNQGHAMYEQRHLARTAVNFTALTPLTFLTRAAAVYPDKLAVVYGPARFTYRQLGNRCRQLADALRGRGIRVGDTVAVVAPNVPALLEAHYGVPMAGAVLNAINTHLDARSIAFILSHGEAKLLIADSEFAPTIAAALDELDTPIPVIEIVDGTADPVLGGTEYEAFLREGNCAAVWQQPSDEWQAIALNYTSGTTGDPKGVVYHHRGAFLSAMGNAITFGLDGDSVYLWTLPMFHCNGWSFTWAVTAVAATHVCLRRADPASIFSTIAEQRVTHLCGAPIVLNLLVHSPEYVKRQFDHVVEIATGGAAPPSAVIEGMERMGFRVTHLYGLTESYGPSTVCAWQQDWSGLPLTERAALMARQGVATLMVDRQRVVDPNSMIDVPADGTTLGELVFRGSTLMKGYFKNPRATETAFNGGWFHTGDLAVQHSDGYIEIKDRSKDIIIVGGDNLSSLEVEDALYRHPHVMEAAVVAKPDAVWGEVPCAFVTVKPDAGAVSPEDIIGWCRANLAQYKVPRIVVFGPLPKTSTGKILKFELRERAKAIATELAGQRLPEVLKSGDALEQELQSICERVSGISPIEWSQNLLECCADSLTVLNLFMEITQSMQCDLPLGAFFEAPTISGLASEIRGVGAEPGPKTPRSRLHPDIRPAGPADIEPLCRFLHEGFSRSGLPLGAWRHLFDYKWLDEKPDFGRVLTIQNEIVGFLGAIYALRRKAGKTGFWCNLSSWYVLPEHRGWGVELLADQLRDERMTFTALTPGPRAVEMLEAMGFTRTITSKVALPPLAQIDTLRERALSISFEPDRVRCSLDDENRRVFDDHAEYDCLRLSVSAGSKRAFLVVKRRSGGNTRLNRLFSTSAKIAYSEVLYCSDPDVLVQHLERIKLAILRRQRTVLLVCDEDLFQKRPIGLLFESPALYRSPLFAPAELDKLYSELVLVSV